MSPNLTARAKRERWARDFQLDVSNIALNWIWLAMHPVMAWFVLRLKLHYSFGLPYPDAPK